MLSHTRIPFPSTLYQPILSIYLSLSLFLSRISVPLSCFPTYRFVSFRFVSPMLSSVSVTRYQVSSPRRAFTYRLPAKCTFHSRDLLPALSPLFSPSLSLSLSFSSRFFLRFPKHLFLPAAEIYAAASRAFSPFSLSLLFAIARRRSQMASRAERERLSRLTRFAAPFVEFLLTKQSFLRMMCIFLRRASENPRGIRAFHSFYAEQVEKSTVDWVTTHGTRRRKRVIIRQLSYAPLRRPTRLSSENSFQQFHRSFRPFVLPTRRSFPLVGASTCLVSLSLSLSRVS